MASEANSLAKYQQNLKRTAFGVKFARTLFTNPDSLSSQQIIIAMKLLGLDVPREVEMTSQLAQVYSSSQTATEGAAAAEAGGGAWTNADFYKAAAYLGRSQGWIDNDTSSMIIVGASLVQIYSSAGMNVAAWAALGLEVMGQEMRAGGLAQNYAVGAAAGLYRHMIDQNAVALQNTILEFSQQKFGVFGFLTKVADQSPLLFENCIQKNPALKPLRDKFPMINFIPVQTGQILGQGSQTTWYGSTQSRDFKIDFKTIGEMNEREAVVWVFGRIFWPMLRGYYEIESSLRLKNKASFTDQAVIASLNPTQFDVSSSRDILTRLFKARVSPKDLGLDLFGSLTDSRKDLALSGFLTKAAKKESTKMEIQNAEKTGSIEVILQNSQARKILESYFDLTGENLTPLMRSIDPTLDYDNINLKPLQNFIAVLDMLDVVLTDPIFKKYQDELPDIAKYGIFPALNDFKKKVSDLLSLSTMRRMNYMAKANIAFYLGAKSVNDIELVSKMSQGQPQVYRRKA